MNKHSGKTNKYAAVITYVIALVCLLLGLFLPLAAGKEIIALQLPEAFEVISGRQSDFIFAYPVSFPGLGTVDIMAWIVVVYTAVCALGVLALIPVLACKKHSKTANVLAYLIEVFALTILSVYLITALERFPAEAFYYSLLIAYGGALLMLILQSLIYKKSTGFAKLVLFILSVLGVICLFNPAVLVSAMHRTWENIAETMKSSSVLYGDSTGISLINLLFGNGFTETLNAAATIKEKTALILALIVAASVIIGYFIDLFGLATNAKKAGYRFNIVRYAFILAAVVCLYITLAFCKTAPGILLYILTATLVIQLLISIIRLIRYGKHKEKEKLYSDDPVLLPANTESTEDDKEENVTASPVTVTAEPAEEIKQTPAEPAPEMQIYKVNAIYQGPSDNFMRKLTNDEKIEFVMTFIEKSKGDLGSIPDYVIGGNNKKFFSSVFIYLGKVRCLISDELLNKMYKELNAL